MVSVTSLVTRRGAQERPHSSHGGEYDHLLFITPLERIRHNRRVERVRPAVRRDHRRHRRVPGGADEHAARRPLARDVPCGHRASRRVSPGGPAGHGAGRPWQGRGGGVVRPACCPCREGGGPGVGAVGRFRRGPGGSVVCRACCPRRERGASGTVGCLWCGRGCPVRRPRPGPGGPGVLAARCPRLGRGGCALRPVRCPRFGHGDRAFCRPRPRPGGPGARAVDRARLG